MTRHFHIRARMPRKGGNQYYKATEARVAKTLCGAPITDHDIRFDWNPAGVGDWQCCDACLKIRRGR